MSPRRPRRRRVVRVVAGVTAAALLAGLAFVVYAAVQYRRALTDTTGSIELTNPLWIPPLAEGEVAPDGTRTYELELTEGTRELVPGTTTTTWGAADGHLGPTLLLRRGDDVEVRVANRLPEATTLHWHGAHLPAVADGGPHQTIAPGDTWTPRWTVDQPAATLWYHPHPHGATTEHVARGVAGMLIVEDPDRTPSGIPARYGVDDVPVILQDVRFGPDGSIATSTPPFGSLGPLGDHLLVNGTFGPSLRVRTEAVRLRLLNASPGRIYHLGFDDDRSFAVVAGDGGMLAEPHLTDRVLLSPGERAEIVVRVEPGERTVLRSGPADLDIGSFDARFAGLHDRFDVLALDAADRLEPSPPLPERLVADEDLADHLPDREDATRVREFELEGRTRINGRSMDMARIDHVIAARTTEVWEVRNGSGTVHNFHVHGVSFRVDRLDGEPPPPELTGPKDTVLLPPGARARLIVRFPDHPDPHTPYMFHCHILRHEDDGMMGQFTLVDPD